LVIGVVYFCFLSGTQAEDNGDSTSDVATAKPDPLFTDRGQYWQHDRSPRSGDATGRGDSTRVQSAYNYGEPGRFEPDPNANPLRPYDDGYTNEQGAAQLVGGGAVAEEDAGATAPGPDTDLFGLRKSVSVGANSEQTNLKVANGTEAASTKSPAPSAIKKASVKQGPAGSSSKAAKSNERSGTARPIGPAAMDDSFPGDDLNGPAEGQTSLFDSARPNMQKSPAVGETKTGNRGRNDFSPRSSGGATGGTEQLGSRYGAIDPSENEPIQNSNIQTSRLNSTFGAGQGSGGLSGNTYHSADGNGRLGNDVNAPIAETSPIGRGPSGAEFERRTSGRPGSRQLDGKQLPQVSIEKIAPEEIQVGKPAKIELRIRNNGGVAAQNVKVFDVVPEGTQFIAANPPATPGIQGDLSWSLGALKPGEESVVEVELAPIAEGEVGSVAVVTFDAEAGARSRATKPGLTLQVSAAKQVMIGQEVLLSIKIGNPGTGAATGVVIREQVPAGLKHSAGAELEFEVGTLKPGETRELELALSAAQAGKIVNQIAARGDANLQAEAQCALEVIAPALEITVDGPARRYLERQATYTVLVTNPGTAPAKDVELVTRLPKGMKFVQANNAGQYDPKTHSVAWSLAELPPAESGKVTLTALPIEPGEQRMRAEGRARQGLADEIEQITVVEGLAALLFEVVDVADPIEVNGETEYEIRIVNQGSKGADNVQLVATLPPELRFVSAEGPTQHAVKGQHVLFEPLGRLSPKADTSYRIAVQGTQAGDLRMKVQLQTDDMQHPVTKEESTRVYSDE
jgi:uncharacterized repeat protein (TIGR01451 family)